MENQQKNFYRICILFYLTIFCSINLYSQNIEEVQDSTRNSNYDSLLKIIHYIDGIEVPAEIIIEKIINGELDSGLGPYDSKNSIRIYGERYRYGLIFWDSKRKKEKDNSLQ